MLPRTVDEVVAALARHGYVADRGLAVTILLSLEMGRPLFLEGEAGVGKTEVAKVLAAILGSELIRLQCYEGLDVNHALYEWDYARQMLAIRLIEARGLAPNMMYDCNSFNPTFCGSRVALTMRTAYSISAGST